MLASLSAIATELVTQLRSEFSSYAPFLAFFFALGWLVQHAAPLALGPSLFDALERKTPLPTDPAKLRVARAKLAQTTSVRVVACVMAVYVSALSLYGLLSPPIAAPLQANLYGETPLTRHLVLVAVGYFLWDLAVCYDQGAEFLVHGLACLCVFACAMVRGAAWRVAGARVLLLPAHLPASHFTTRSVPSCTTWPW